jgi:hypothetical protein
MRNPLVMLLDERDRRNIVPGHEVSDIHVRAVIFCQGKSRLPMFGLCSGVPVITDHELVLSANCPSRLRSSSLCEISVEIARPPNPHAQV